MAAEQGRDLYMRGLAAAKAGDREEARFYLEWALREWDLYGESNYAERAEAWFWLSRTYDDAAKSRECLEMALALYPGHPEARRELAILDGRLRPEEMVDLRNPLSPVEPPAAVPTGEARRYVCPRCGGQTFFEPGVQALACPYCGNRWTADGGRGTGGEQDFAAALPTARAHRWELPVERVLACQGCGANIVLPPSQLAGTCPFCGTAYVLDPRGRPDLGGLEQIIQPGAIIPFQFDADAAAQYAQRWLAQKDIAPPVAVKPRPVYLPFWVFTVGGQVGWRGWVVRERLDGRTERVERSGSHLVWQEGILVPATGKGGPAGPPLQMRFDLSALAPYSPDYLADWPAEIYRVPLADASLSARQRAFETAKEQVRVSALALERVEDLTYDSSGLVVETFQLALLPVWLASYEHGEQVYSLVVNGQTGEVRGEAPKGGLRRWLEGLMDG